MERTRDTQPFTIFGLLFAAFCPTLILSAFRLVAPQPLTNSFVIARELSLFFAAGVLLLIVVKGEKLDLGTIGLNNRNWGRSILWSLIMMITFIGLILALLGVFQLLHISYGKGDSEYDKISLWVISLMMLRAGIVEELFYRGYMMERLYKINQKWVVYFLFPAVLFGILHYRQGLGGIIIAVASGLVISYFYWKRRDLKSNIIAHFLVDFIPNVLVPLIIGS